MDAVLLWLFFFLALVIGWVLGYSSRSKKSKDEGASYPENEHVKHRLQLLFDSYSDDSIDGFVRTLEVNAETLPIHLSIGKHFRREGEVDKAILIHQNLMARPELSDAQTDPVIYELAKDYKAAGLFDRAEALLVQLLESKRYAAQSITLMLDILQNEKDWERALELANHPSIKKNPDNVRRLAQFCCELVEQKLRERDYMAAKQLLKRAASYDKQASRVMLLQAELDADMGRYRQAISSLRRLAERFPEKITLALPLFQKCTEATESQERFREFLIRAYEETRQMEILLALVASFTQQGDTDSAYRVLDEQMRKMPSLVGLNELIKHEVEENRSPEQRDLLVVIAKVLKRLVNERASYQCEQCGFESQKMYWMCPSCKQWETIQPLVEYGSKV